MKKNIFGIAAAMLLVGTMALMSCSEDAGLGFDEEWDDIISRSEMPRIKDDGGDDDGPYEWKGNECAAKALAETCKGGAKGIKKSTWREIAIALSGSVENYERNGGFTAEQVLAASKKLGGSFTTATYNPSKSTIYTALGVDSSNQGVKGTYSVNPNIVQIGGHFTIAVNYIVKRDGTEEIKCKDFDGNNYSYPTYPLTDTQFYAIIY